MTLRNHANGDDFKIISQTKLPPRYLEKIYRSFNAIESGEITGVQPDCTVVDFEGELCSPPDHATVWYLKSDLLESSVVSVRLLVRALPVGQCAHCCVGMNNKGKGPGCGGVALFSDYLDNLRSAAIPWQDLLISVPVGLQESPVRAGTVLPPETTCREYKLRPGGLSSRKAVKFLREEIETGPLDAARPGRDSRFVIGALDNGVDGHAHVVGFALQEDVEEWREKVSADLTDWLKELFPPISSSSLRVQLLKVESPFHEEELVTRHVFEYKKGDGDAKADQCKKIEKLLQNHNGRACISCAIENQCSELLWRISVITAASEKVGNLSYRAALCERDWEGENLYMLEIKLSSNAARSRMLHCSRQTLRSFVVNECSDLKAAKLPLSVFSDLSYWLRLQPVDTMIINSIRDPLKTVSIVPPLQKESLRPPILQGVRLVPFSKMMSLMGSAERIVLIHVVDPNPKISLEMVKSYVETLWEGVQRNLSYTIVLLVPPFGGCAPLLVMDMFRLTGDRLIVHHVLSTDYLPPSEDHIEAVLQPIDIDLELYGHVPSPWRNCPRIPHAYAKGGKYPYTLLHSDPMEAGCKIAPNYQEDAKRWHLGNLNHMREVEVLMESNFIAPPDQADTLRMKANDCLSRTSPQSRSCGEPFIFHLVKTQRVCGATTLLWWFAKDTITLGVNVIVMEERGKVSDQDAKELWRKLLQVAPVNASSSSSALAPAPRAALYFDDDIPLSTVSTYIRAAPSGYHCFVVFVSSTSSRLKQNKKVFQIGVYPYMKSDVSISAFYDAFYLVDPIREQELKEVKSRALQTPLSDDPHSLARRHIFNYLFAVRGETASRNIGVFVRDNAEEAMVRGKEVLMALCLLSLYLPVDVADAVRLTKRIETLSWANLLTSQRKDGEPIRIWHPFLAYLLLDYMKLRKAEGLRRCYQALCDVAHKDDLYHVSQSLLAPGMPFHEKLKEFPKEMALCVAALGKKIDDSPSKKSFLAHMQLMVSNLFRMSPSPSVTDYCFYARAACLTVDCVPEDVDVSSVPYLAGRSMLPILAGYAHALETQKLSY